MSQACPSRIFSLTQLRVFSFDIYNKNESLVGHVNGGEMIVCKKMNIAKDADMVAYWIACGPSDNLPPHWAIG